MVSPARRIVLASSGTLAGLVLLLSHSTSTSSTLAGSPRPSPGKVTSAPGGTSVTGSVAQTRWGPVQVQISVRAGKVVGATALQVPDGNPRDQEINAYAVPVLEQETVAAGTARIDTVSGATVTSEGYITSLQAALDAAHLS